MEARFGDMVHAASHRIRRTAHPRTRSPCRVDLRGPRVSEAEAQVGRTMGVKVGRPWPGTMGGVATYPAPPARRNADQSSTPGLLMPDGASESPRRGNPQSCTTPDEKTAVTGTVPMYRHVAAMDGFEIRQEWHRSIPRAERRVCLSVSRYYALCTLHFAPCASHLTRAKEPSLGRRWPRY
jgi:hypothetical protein